MRAITQEMILEAIYGSRPKPKKVKRKKPERKMKNRPTEVDGISFDSRKEAERWQTLKLLEQAGEITDLQRQVKYELIPAQRDGNGKCIERSLSYMADFVYNDHGTLVVEDVKGYRDPSSAPYAKFVIKRKLMLYTHNIRVREL